MTIRSRPPGQGAEPHAHSVSIDQSVLTTTRTLAFLFTDVEGSTRLWERDPAAMRVALAEHDRILAEAVARSGGRVVKTTGDGVMAVFETARDGVEAALAAQRGLVDAAWGSTGPLRVRMGLHVGEGQGDGHDYHGQAVNRAARIMAAGHGGQVLLSGPTAALVLDQLPTGTTLRDLGEHQLKDLARSERVYQLDYPGMRPDGFAPLASGEARVRSLPAEPSRFTGRDVERAQLAERLRDPELRLLTLTGPGGIGKTRLALRVALDVEQRFTAGAVFVDLASARDSNAVLTAIARALGFVDVATATLLDELVARIAERHLLLILDNMEQAISSAPALARLLAGCPRLALLVTSREPLHIRGEHLHAVQPLGVPDERASRPSAGDLGAFEAVLLFVERAREVRPDFAVSDDNAAVVADICRRLEGVPLAIELAAARLRIFSLEALRERLGSRLRALGGGARDLPERQQTLRATIDWSYQLLPPAEQRLLAVMACFRGATLDAVEHVGGALGPWLGDGDPVEGVISLADKSLLRRRGDDGGEVRLEMLESVREFASEQLAADPELERPARAAHLAHYADLAQRLGAAIRSVRRGVALDELERELANLRTAWPVAVERADLERIEQLLDGLRPLYDARGWYRGLTDLSGDALRALDTLEPSPQRAVGTLTLLSDRARALTAMHGYVPEAEAAYEDLFAALREEDVPDVYPVLRGLATYYSFRADHRRAAEMGRRILALGEREGDPMVRADGHLMLGTGTSFSGRLEDGLPILEAGVALWDSGSYEVQPRRVGPDPRVGTLTSLSLLCWWEGRLETSLLRSEQAVALAQRLEHPSSIGYAVYHAALLRLWMGDAAAARELAVHVIAHADEHELPIWSTVGSVVLGASAVALGADDGGLSWIAEGLERYRGLRMPPIFWPFLLLVQAEACLRAGRMVDGIASVGEALTLAPQLPDLHLVHGDLRAASADTAAARIAYEEAADLASRWGAGTPLLRARLRLLAMDGEPDVEARGRRLAELRAVYARFTEGLDSHDLVAARQILEDAG